LISPKAHDDSIMRLFSATVTLALAGRSTDFSRCVKKPRWSSSSHDKAMHDSGFAGRLDFNQRTRKVPVKTGTTTG